MVERGRTWMYTYFMHSFISRPIPEPTSDKVIKQFESCIKPLFGSNEQVRSSSVSEGRTVPRHEAKLLYPALPENYPLPLNTSKVQLSPELSDILIKCNRGSIFHCWSSINTFYDLISWVVENFQVLCLMALKIQM